MLGAVPSPAPMLRLAALALLATGASAQPVRPDTLVAVPVQTVGSAPLQTSGVVAALFSVGTTGVLTGLGYVVIRAAPAVDYENQSEVANVIETLPLTFGLMLVSAGVLAGPMVGNASLGADADLLRSALIKTVGLTGAGVLVAVGAGAFVLSALTLGSVPLFDSAYPVAFKGAAVAAAAGVGIGAAHDLLSIPANARRARAYRASRSVTVAPTASLRRGAPVVGIVARF